MKRYEDKSEYVIGGAPSSLTHVHPDKGHVLIRNLFSASKRLRNQIQHLTTTDLPIHATDFHKIAERPYSADT